MCTLNVILRRLAIADGAGRGERRVGRMLFDRVIGLAVPDDAAAAADAAAAGKSNVAQRVAPVKHDAAVVHDFAPNLDYSLLRLGSGAAGIELTALGDGEGLALRDQQTSLIIPAMGHAQAHLRGHGHVARQLPREERPDAAAEVAEGLDLRIELVQHGLLVRHVEGDVKQRVLAGEEILPINQRIGVEGVVLDAQLTAELEAAVAAELEIPLHIHRPAFRYHQRPTAEARRDRHGEA